MLAKVLKQLLFRTLLSFVLTTFIAEKTATARAKKGCASQRKTVNAFLYAFVATFTAHFFVAN